MESFATVHTIAAIIALWQLALEAPEGHIASRWLHACLAQQVAQPHTSPVAGADCTWPPVETNGLFVHVFLLAAITCG